MKPAFQGPGAWSSGKQPPPSPGVLTEACRRVVFEKSSDEVVESGAFLRILKSLQCVASTTLHDLEFLTNVFPAVFLLNFSIMKILLVVKDECSHIPSIMFILWDAKLTHI